MKARVVVTVCVMGLAASVAFGQDGPFAGPRGALGRVLLLLRRDVQKELKLSEEQESAIAAEYRSAFGEPGPSWEARAARMEKRLEKTLCSAQQKRYAELLLQWEGPEAMGRKLVADRIGLTEAQRGDIRTIRSEVYPAVRNDFQGFELMADYKAMRARLEWCRAEVARRTLALLTGDQREKWEALKGRPFSFERGAG